MRKVLIVDNSSVGQALKQVLEVVSGKQVEVLLVKDEDALIDALGTFPAEAMIIGALNDKDLAEFARVNAKPGQRVLQLGWEKDASPSPDPSYVRLPILGADLLKRLLEI